MSRLLGERGDATPLDVDGRCVPIDWPAKRTGVPGEGLLRCAAVSQCMAARRSRTCVGSCRLGLGPSAGSSSQVVGASVTGRIDQHRSARLPAFWSTSRRHLRLLQG